MTVLFCICMLFGAYVRRFSKDFEEEDRSKVIVFVCALLVIGVVLSFLSN